MNKPDKPITKREQKLVAAERLRCCKIAHEWASAVATEDMADGLVEEIMEGVDTHETVELPEFLRKSA